MSAIAKLLLIAYRSEVNHLRGVIADISHHIGGSPGLEETVVEAAESARAALNRHLGHSDIPRDADGVPLAFNVVGR